MSSALFWRGTKALRVASLGAMRLVLPAAAIIGLVPLPNRALYIAEYSIFRSDVGSGVYSRTCWSNVTTMTLSFGLS